MLRTFGDTTEDVPVLSAEHYERLTEAIHREPEVQFAPIVPLHTELSIDTDDLWKRMKMFGLGLIGIAGFIGIIYKGYE
jgi:hypothetical protein